MPFVGVYWQRKPTHPSYSAATMPGNGNVSTDNHDATTNSGDGSISNGNATPGNDDGSSSNGNATPGSDDVKLKLTM